MNCQRSWRAGEPIEEDRRGQGGIGTRSRERAVAEKRCGSELESGAGKKRRGAKKFGAVRRRCRIPSKLNPTRRRNGTSPIQNHASCWTARRRVSYKLQRTSAVIVRSRSSCGGVDARGQRQEATGADAGEVEQNMAGSRSRPLRIRVILARLRDGPKAEGPNCWCRRNVRNAKGGRASADQRRF